jgi:hypothetical protein
MFVKDTCRFDPWMQEAAERNLRRAKMDHKALSNSSDKIELLPLGIKSQNNEPVMPSATKPVQKKVSKEVQTKKTSKSFSSPLMQKIFKESHKDRKTIRK